MAVADLVTAQEITGLSNVIRAIEVQQRVNAELTNLVARAEREIQAELERLKRDETREDQAENGVAEFRQLRSEVDGRKIRLSNIAARISYSEEQVARLHARIARLEEEEVTASPTRLEDVAALVELRKLRELSDLITQSIGLRERVSAAINQRLAVLEERAALIQSRSHLTSLDETKELERDSRVVAIREIVERLGDDSVRLANEASGMNSAASDVQARRQLLELQADAAATLSNMRAYDIDLLGIGRQVAFLQMLVAEPSVPLRLLKEGVVGLDRLADRVARRLSGVGDVRRQLAQQSSTLPLSSFGSAAGVENLKARADELATLANDQEDEARRLGTAIGGLRQEFDRRINRTEAEALYQRTSLPAGLEAWGRLAASVLRLPLQVAQGFKRAADEVVEALGGASAARLAALGLVALILGLVVMVARRLRQDRTIEPGGAVDVPWAALKANLYTLMPAIAWLAVAGLLGLSGASTLLVLTVVAVWPVVAFLLDLARRLLFHDPRFAESTVRRRFFGQLRWTLILAGIIGALVTVTRTLPINPVLANIIDRSAMLCLLLIAVPGLLLPGLILSVWSDSRGRPSHRAQFAAGLSTLVPVALASAALLGLFGYLNFAWGVTIHLLWLAIVGGILLLLLGLLRDGVSELRGRLAARSRARGDFWIVNFFDPAYRLVQLALSLAAGWMLVKIYGWTAGTPGVRHLLAFGRTPVMSLGEAALTIQDIALAVMMVLVAFWLGGWSRQISYNVALARIRDVGIRQSLSVFVQYVVTVLVLVLTLKIIGLDLTALTVFAASLGVGIGFGMQNVVNNFISGVLLLAERPLRVGDVVTIGGNTGEVTRIGIRSLTVRTSDHKDILIPNSAVISDTFTNWTRTDDILRETLQFRVSQIDDPEQTAGWIAEAARNTEGVLPMPAPKASVWELTDSGATIRLEYMVRMRGTAGGADVRANILRRVRTAFAAMKAQGPADDRKLAQTLVSIN